MTAPLSEDRLAEIAAALAAVPAPPWAWIGTRHAGGPQLVTDHSGRQYILRSSGRVTLPGGEEVTDDQGCPVYGDLVFRDQRPSERYAAMRTGSQLGVGRTDYDPDSLVGVDNPVAEWLRRSAEYAQELLAKVRRLRAITTATQTGHASPAVRTVPAGVRCLLGDLNAHSGFAESCWVVPAPKRWALLFPREDGPLYFTVSRQHKTIDEAVRLGLIRLSDSLMPLPAHTQVPTWLSRTVSQPLEGYRISALGGAK